jgi:predicted aspartyl protease
VNRMNCNVFKILIVLTTTVGAFTPVAVAKAKPEFSVPFTWSSPGHVMVDAVINDTWKISMAVDTGAQYGLLPEIAVDKLGIKPDDISIQHAMTATDTRQLKYTQVNSISVGGHKIRNQNVLLLDVGHLDEANEAPTGVLPVTFINQFNVHFDLANQRLEFYDKATDVAEYLELNNYAEVDYQSIYGFIKFPVQINDQIIQAVLDTGASGNPIINWQAANLLGVEKGNLKLEEGRDIQGVGKHKHQTQKYEFERFRIGGIDLPATTLDIFDMPHFKQLLGKGPAVNVGLSALGPVSLLVDYENQRLFLGS